MMNMKRFREGLGLAATDEQKAVRLLADVTALFQKSTNRIWVPIAGLTMTWETESTQSYLWTTAFPIATITSLQEWWQIDGSAGATDVSAQDYYVRLNRGEIRKLRPQPWKNFVTIVYDSAGIPPDQIPADIQEALILQARFQEARFSSNKVDVRSQAFDKSSTQFLSADYHPKFWEVVKNHKRRIYGPHG